MWRYAEGETHGREARDGVAPEEAMLLHDGAVVTIVQRTEESADDAPWRAIIPTSCSNP